MSIFYERLKNTFHLTTNYKLFYDLNSLYPILRKYLLDSIKAGEKYVEADDFAYTYGLDGRFTLELFLQMSKNNILIKYYSLSCDHCNGFNIAENPASIIQCVHCGELMFDFDNEDINKKPLDFVNFLFKINPEILEELILDLKMPPSSVTPVTEEGFKEVITESENNYPAIEDEERKFLEALNEAAKIA